MTWEALAAVTTAVVAALVAAINEFRKGAERRREARAVIEERREKDRAALEALRPDVLRSWQQVVEEVRREREAIRQERDELRRTVSEIRRAHMEEITSLKEEHERDRLAWAGERARAVDERADLQTRYEEALALIETMRYGRQATDTQESP